MLILLTIHRHACTRAHTHTRTHPHTPFPAGSEKAKYAAAGDSVVYGKTGDARRLGLRVSVATSASEILKPSHYKVPDKRGVMAVRKDQEIKPKRFVATTEYGQGYEDTKETMALAIPHVLETSINAKKPPVGSTSAVTQAITLENAYKGDFGTYGSKPGRRTCMTAAGGMAGTTGDLFDGTTKNSTNIPGYMGFLPHTKNLMPDERPRDTGLIQTYRTELPGYTGHVAGAPTNIRARSVAASYSTTAGEDYGRTARSVFPNMAPDRN